MAMLSAVYRNHISTSTDHIKRNQSAMRYLVRDQVFLLRKPLQTIIRYDRAIWDLSIGTNVITLANL
jgi:hypothetical protein